MDTVTKRAVIATGIIVVAVSTHIVANAIYTNTTIGVHKKAVIIGAGVGILAMFTVLTMLKKSS